MKHITTWNTFKTLICGLLWMMVGCCAVNAGESGGASSGSFSSTSRWEEGTHYKVLSQIQTPALNEPVGVLEFFSYACPWCHQMEPAMEQLSRELPKDVRLLRTPVVFHPGWERLAQAYYTIQALNRVKDLHHAFFEAIQMQHLSYQQDEPLVQFFVDHGIARDVFLNTYQSFGVDRAVKQGQQQLFALELNSVPTVVVDGRYYTEPGMVGKDPKAWVELILFLVNKADKVRKSIEK